MIERDTISCETCGQPTPMLGTKRCNNCWEVERRLGTYMRSPKALDFIRKHLPKLDDWVDNEPDAWDYERVLADNNVTIEWSHQLTSDGETFTEAPPDVCGWGFYWKHGAIHIGRTTEQIARKAAALFVSLWLRGVSASFCDKLMDGYIHHLECRENTRLTFLAEIDRYPDARPYFHLTRENFCTQASFTLRLEKKIIEALGEPADDEEIIVTFTRRKKA
jgi:hypothetical protein